MLDFYSPEMTIHELKRQRDFWLEKAANEDELANYYKLVDPDAFMYHAWLMVDCLVKAEKFEKELSKNNAV